MTDDSNLKSTTANNSELMELLVCLFALLLIGKKSVGTQTKTTTKISLVSHSNFANSIEYVCNGK
jgi:hypothetical protein